MFFIFLSFFISSIYFLILGFISSKILFNGSIKEDDDYYEFGLIGIIIAAITAFLINFFISLNLYVNDLLFILPFIIIFFNNGFRQNINIKKIINISLLVALISTILISYDNVYRPDAGSYHLPFISILNDNKIIIGLSNLHFRFGHISIIQYLSASFNNHLFFDNGILIPGGLIFTFLTLYLLKRLNVESNNINYLIIFIFLIFIFFRMNRYSSFGNDAPAHFYFIFLMILSINYKKYINNYYNFFNKICLISIFIFFNKITMLLSFVIPLFFIFNKKILKIYKNKIFIFLVLIFLSWIGKNILTSGCAAFPLEQTCIKQLQWFDKSEIRRSNAISGRIENEAWTKGAANQSEKNFEEYIQSFEWINTWKQNHGKKIIKKITPFFIFISIITLYFIIFGERKKTIFFEKKDKFLWFLIFLNLLGSILWFIKFPVFRYGYGYLIGFFGILYSLVLLKFYQFNNRNLRKKNKIIFIIFFIVLFSKHSFRVYENLDVKKSAWPSIYSDTPSNKKFKLFPQYNDKKLIFFVPEDTMCYYTNLTPCTNMAFSEYNIRDIKLEIINGYKKYFFIR